MTDVTEWNWIIDGKLAQGRVPSRYDIGVFNTIVLCAQEVQRIPDFNHRLQGKLIVQAPMDDSDPIQADTLRHAIKAAKIVSEHLRRGRKALVTCQAGLNRSGLVNAFVLIDLGYTPLEAIQTIRAKRDPYALCNDAFVATIASIVKAS